MTRLHDVLIAPLEEVTVFDVDGGVLLVPNLRMRHRKTGFEYTVDDVVRDKSDGSVSVVLRLPHEPRKFADELDDASCTDDIVDTIVVPQIELESEYDLE